MKNLYILSKFDPELNWSEYEKDIKIEAQTSNPYSSVSYTNYDPYKGYTNNNNNNETRNISKVGREDDDEEDQVE